MGPDEYADRETERWHASKAWTQVDVDDDRGPGVHGIALMPLDVFNELADYSCTLPTGTFVGKRWKRLQDDQWWMGEYVDDPNPERIGILWREIYIRNLFGDDICTRATVKNFAAVESIERLAR